MNKEQLIQTLNNVLDALMTVSVKGADTITMGNVLQAMQQIIDDQAQQVRNEQQQPQFSYDPQSEMANQDAMMPELDNE